MNTKNFDVKFGTRSGGIYGDVESLTVWIQHGNEAGIENDVIIN